ncbi:hypothetical protein TNCV_2576371 [Trichonephila clavipes]|uniref:Uncharacterized protein n=1 Tax=Trichonephila clavipes TaxID=2585209 RepID=A0A8X6R7G5_TRICX|nr:hypothetical protein TNCV_2576371 [Trichonephila clavipes]
MPQPKADKIDMFDSYKVLAFNGLIDEGVDDIRTHLSHPNVFLPSSCKIGSLCRKHYTAGRRAVLLARWVVRSVPLEIVGSSGHKKVPTCGKPGLERPGRPRGSKDRAASTCGPHSDSFNDTSRRRRSNCSTNNFQTPSRSKS